ncbi:MAG: ABC transporter substrate-binding protein [Lachnospiraceae bacterium]|nr:ABC transporter substrate-binding protein [Lachnospiraceae bacterium]
MKRSMILLTSLLVLLLAVALCGCAGDKSGNGSTITVGIPQDIEDSLDPHLAVAAGTREVLFNIYEGLVKPNSNGELVPALASEYSVDAEGKTYTFTLRKGVKFHDGEPVTVQDVVASIERCADTSNGEPLVAAFSNIAGIEAADDSTVVITLKEADTEFISYMTTAILEAKYIADPTSDPVGTGPYMFVSRSPQENIVLKSFKDYWGEKAYIENVTFKIISNPDTIVMNLEGGSIDMFPRVTTAQAAQLSDKFNIEEGTMNLVQALYLNNAVKPFDDVRVRQALCYAIDPQEIMDYAFDGIGSEIGSSMFPSFGKYFMPELNDVYNQDIDKAKGLLAEAGYPDGFEFTIKVPSNYTQHVDTAQVLKEEFKKIGVTADIELIEWNSWLSDVYSGREYEATVIGVDASSLTPSALLSRFQSEAGNNFVNFNSAEYDAAYAAAVASTDDAKQTEYFKQCEEILAKEAANVYIQDPAELVAISNKYTGYEFYPLYAQDISKIRIADK